MKIKLNSNEYIEWYCKQLELKWNLFNLDLNELNSNAIEQKLRCKL